MKQFDRHFEFFILLTLLILTRVLDGILTYKITPDLSRELNPLVSLFGMGWAGLITIALLILIPTVVLNYLSLYKPFDNFPDNDASFADFKKFYFSTDNPNLKNATGKIIIQTLGYIVPRVFIIWGFWVILHNYLVFIDQPTYKYLRSEYKIWLIGYLLPGILGVLLTNPFLKSEFRRFKKCQKQS
ncbi:MAG: hypothetical protein KatS3mg028_1418 [Bacteroidia bacterium]|nr:MAG: hypothetical protein KatS3mg028_1418 [Bacteroidia bacterium]GIV34113.1 MAG: hypothetical protein KatS3mg031_1648 [Chitinophagales bacterium]